MARASRPHPGLSTPQEDTARPSGTLELAIGPFDSRGAPLRTVEYRGIALTAHISEGTRALGEVGRLSSLRVERVAYFLPEEGRFAVHTVLRSGNDQHPVLARMEIFEDRPSLALGHPDLARSIPSRKGGVPPGSREPSPVAAAPLSPAPRRRRPRA